MLTSRKTKRTTMHPRVQSSPCSRKLNVNHANQKQVKPLKHSEQKWDFVLNFEIVTCFISHFGVTIFGSRPFLLTLCFPAALSSIQNPVIKSMYLCNIKEPQVQAVVFERLEKKRDKSPGFKQLFSVKFLCVIQF